MGCGISGDAQHHAFGRYWPVEWRLFHTCSHSWCFTWKSINFTLPWDACGHKLAHSGAWSFESHPCRPNCIELSWVLRRWSTSYVPRYLFTCCQISDADAVAIGRCKANKEHPHPFNQTLTGQKLSGVVDSSVNQLYVTGTEVYLLNGDKCVVGQHVIIQPSHLNSPTFIACLHEIIQQVGSQNHNNSKPDGLLLETVDSSRTSTKFRMPRLQNVNEWSFVPISVSSGLLLCQELFVKYFSRTYYALSILSTISTPTNVQPVGFVIFIKNMCGPSVEHWLCSISPTEMTSFCRMWFPWANAIAMSWEGACRLLWTLLAQMIALKDSEASVAKRMAGLNRRIWAGRCKIMWNFDFLNQSHVHWAVLSKKFLIACSTLSWITIITH